MPAAKTRTSKESEDAPSSSEGAWTSWTSFTSDHTRFVSILPWYLGCYAFLSPYTTECVMNTMNDTCPEITCPYCTGLHGELLRLCRKPEGNNTNNATIINTSDPSVAYAKTFCLGRGRGKEVETKHYAKLVDAIGSSKASSVHALCWALLWGQTTGNTVNGARNKLFSGGPISSLEVFVTIWYGPLFIAIGILNAILKNVPGSFPSLVSASLGVVLWIPQALFITPIGLVSLIQHGGRVV